MTSKAKTKTKYIRFDYFQPYLVTLDTSKKKKVSKKFDLLNWLTEFNKEKDMEKRTRTHQQEAVRLDNIFVDESTNYTLIHFSRLRDTNLPSITNKIANELKDINLGENEFIAEDISCLYDYTLNVLMVQRNVHSLSPSGIGDYITSFVNDGNSYIDLRPVCYNEAFKKGTSKSIFRSLTLKTADTSKNTNLFSKENPISRAFSELKSIEGHDIEITITSSRKKDDKLNSKEVKQILNDFEDMKEGLSKAEIRFREGENTKVEYADLIQGRIYSYLPFDMPPKKSLNPDSVQLSMLNEYNPKVSDKRTEIRNNLPEYNTI